jgi:hypothetical protein
MSGAARALDPGRARNLHRPNDPGGDPSDPCAVLPFVRVEAGAAPILRDGPDLRAFLEETCAAIRKVFAGTSEFVVRRFEDPESPESTPSLMLLVRTALDADAASRLLERFDVTWWLDNAPRGDGRLEVSIEFV